MKKLLNALRFLTIIPVPGFKHADLGEAGKSAAFFPLVGLVIGAIMCAAAVFLNRIWSPAVTAVLVTALWIILTAGIHVDGLADLADGIGGGWDIESRLKIMKDSSIGTYGALAVGILLMLKAVFIHYIGNTGGLYAVLLMVPTAARGVQVSCIRIFRPARQEGFGAVFKAGVTTSGMLAALAVSMAALTAVWGFVGLAVLAAGFLFMLAAGAWIVKRLGGLNGDSYGAICELTEVFLLIVLSVLRPAYSGWLGLILPWPV